MDWKNSLEGLEEFSELADARARKIAFDKTQIVQEKVQTADTSAEYVPLVEEVYKYFAVKTGGRYRRAKMGDDAVFYIENVPDIEDFERLNVFPEVRVMPCGGIMVELPLRAEESSNRCRQILDLQADAAEGYYEYRRPDSEGGWINSKGYFIPFGVFTQQKLAQKLAEIYKEATRNYLKELKG